MWTTGITFRRWSSPGWVKRFGDNVAVDHIDLAVPAGSFFGLVGPNGAGKTTSLSMAVGLLRPDGGTVRIFGREVATAADPNYGFADRTRRGCRPSTYPTNGG